MGANGNLCQNIEALVITTAAKDNNYRENDYPGAVVVKDVA
jgi:hypothetical protein